MKKTIAKIMAAAMVLSSVAAPNALAAVTGYTSGTFLISSYKVGGDEIIKDGVYTGTDEYISFNETGANALLAASTSSTNFVAPATTGYSIGTVAGYTDEATLSVYVASTSAAATGDGPVKTDDAVTNTTASTTKSVSVNTNTIDTILEHSTSATNNAMKVAVNGEFNDVVTANDLRSWFRLRLDANGVPRPEFNFGYTKWPDWAAKLVAGGIVRGTTDVWNAAGTARVFRNFPVRIAFPTGVANDDYWNAIVKLKTSNNRYVPIRVHVDYNDKSLAGANLGLWTEMVNGTTIRAIGNVITTNALAINGLANNRLELQDVNPYDYEILKSDIAKGKNLMLDKAYVFNTTDARNDNGLYSAMSNWEDFFNLGVDVDFGVVSIGKIDKIHASLFKKCKFKYVDAQNAKFINNGAFRECKQLKKARIGDEKNMKKINTKAFYKCKKLATVKLSGKQLKRVGKDAFKECKSNMIFKIKGNATQVKKAAKMLLKQAPKKARYAKI